MKAEIYLQKALESMPRVLTQLNRSQPSRTYGSFDRDYWHYPLSDFNCMRKQEAVLSLALAYSTPHKDNPYYNSPQILNLIKGSLNYWTKKAKQGLNEWYPKEDSFVCNAFNLYAITETFLVLKITPPHTTLKQIEQIARYLAITDEKRVQNQLTAVPIGLFNTWLLTNNVFYKETAEKKINMLGSLQDEEGWFLEYGGVDIGYLSLAIDYLAKYHHKSKNPAALNIVKKACDFLQYFLHPDFTSGGEYASRNTEYLIPSGFEIIADKVPSAASIAFFIRLGLKKNKLISPEKLDDRYLTYLLYNFFEAHIHSKKIKAKKPPFTEPFHKTFPHAGLTVVNKKDYYFVVNSKKGGAFQIITSNKHIYDSGTSVLCNNTTYTSSFINENSIVKQEDNLIVIKGFLTDYKEKTMSTRNLLLLRIFLNTIGRSKKIKQFVKEKLRDLLISKNKPGPVRFERKFIIEDKKVIVEDKVESREKIKKVFLGQKYSNIFVPSSRIFLPQHIRNDSIQEFDVKDRSFEVKRLFSAS